MNPARKKSVWRYFIPADTFVRIRICGGRAGLSPQPGLNQSSYRRLAIQVCCPDLGKDLDRSLEQLAPHDPQAAEELLYQLCIEVNPELDIHRVTLVEGEPEEPSGPQAATQTESRKPVSEADSREAWQRRLRRSSRHLAARLGKRIVGQGQAIEVVERAVRKAAAGLAEEHRPLASFLFVGRTGTGKTELVRRLAEELYGATSEQALVRVDCSEFSAGHEYAKLIGAPPGYIGHENGGFLTDAVRRNPECVVLFDEIEKAHTRMHQLLLQVIDEGHLSDSRGRRVDFGRTLVVMTSNLGTEEIQGATRRVGFRGEDTVEHADQRELTNVALEHRFSPEFLGRIDERLVFRELDLEDARIIGRGLLNDLRARAGKRSIELALTPAVAAWVAREGYDPSTGARELRRVVQREIEGPLSELLLDSSLPEGARVQVSVRQGALHFAVRD